MGLGALLGSGQVAEVYQWGDDVIKLYRPGQGKAQAFREASNLALLEGRSLPVPIVRSVVAVEGRWGVVMERAAGRPMAAATPSDAGPAVAALARLQWQLHQQTGSGLPPLRDRLWRNIAAAEQLDASERAGLTRQLEGLPTGDRLCHGDFHPGNIMVAQDRYSIVDWLDATQGAPEADACRSYLLLLHHVPELAADYLDAYLRNSGGERAAVLAWLGVLAGARLSENVPDENQRLLALARGSISRKLHDQAG